MRKTSQGAFVEFVTKIESLPIGWRLEVTDRGTKDRWLVLQGPKGECAAFACERGEFASPRSKVLDQFMAAAS